MPPHLHNQLRNRIIVWRYEGGKSATEIAELADCSECTVYEILRLHRDFGQVNNPFMYHRGRPRCLQQGDITFISSILDADPTLYLDEIQQRLLHEASSLSGDPW
jgi:transposase